jgi:hypothetical protein
MSNRRRTRPGNTELNPNSYTWLELELLCILYAGVAPKCYNKTELGNEIKLGMLRMGELDPELPPRNKSCYMQVAQLGLRLLGYRQRNMQNAIFEEILLKPRGHPHLEVVNTKSFEKGVERKDVVRTKFIKKY